jgi:hypothetical protein
MWEGGPRELKARRGCFNYRRRMGARTSARSKSAGSPGAADRHGPSGAAISAFDPTPNPSLYELRDELRHDRGHVPRRLQREQFPCRCPGSGGGTPSGSQRSLPMLSELHNSTAYLQTILHAALLTAGRAQAERNSRSKPARVVDRVKPARLRSRVEVVFSQIAEAGRRRQVTLTAAAYRCVRNNIKRAATATRIVLVPIAHIQR